MNDPETLKSIDAKLSALLALIAGFAERSPEEDRKIEVILSQAGLSNIDIARLLGKKVTAVQKAIQRARK